MKPTTPLLLLFAFAFSFCTQNPNYTAQSNIVNASSMAQHAGSELAIGDSTLDVKIDLNNQYFLSTDTGIYYYAELNAPEYTNPNVERVPLNISMVIDKSGSMSGDKLKYVTEAAIHLVRNMAPEDYLSIVVYDYDVRVLAESQLITKPEQLISLIQSIESNGGTNLSGGMLKGYNEVKSSYKQGFVNRVLLLSDGLANEGITDPTKLQKFASDFNQQNNISLSTFGVGADFNEDLMLDLAEYGSGNYYFIESPENIASIFEQELNGLKHIVAQNIALKITIPQGLVLHKMYGFENSYSQVGNEITVNLRDISSKQKKAFVLWFKGFENLETITIASQLTFNDATELGSLKTFNFSSSMTKTANKELITQFENKSVTGQFVLFHSNFLQEEAMRAIDRNDYDGAERFFMGNSRYLKSNAVYNVVVPELEVQDSIVNAYNIDSIRTMNEQQKKVYQKSNKMRSYEVKKKK